MNSKALVSGADVARRSRGKKENGVDQNSQHISHIKDYVLNIEKNLAKKLMATQRKDNILYEFKDGGVVITSDAVTFELIKRATDQYYTNFPPHFGTANIQKSADSTKNNVVQNTIRVKDKGLCYTVNLYNTTSRLLVNGKNVELFLNRDVRQIHDIIQKVTSAEPNFNIDKLNQSLALQLETLLTNNGTVNHENRDCEETGTTIYGIQCIKCKRNCKNRSTYCSTGKHWVHYRCEKLPEEAILAIESSSEDQEYTCKFCKHNKDSSIPISLSLTIPKITSQGNQPQEILNVELLQLEDSCNDMCSLCCGGIKADTDACEQCNLQVHRTCMSEYENMCRNCESVIEGETLNSPLRTVSTLPNSQPTNSLNSTCTEAQTSPNDQVNTVICNDRGMMNCDTVSINIDDNKQNNFSQPKSKINSPVDINSQETTGHIISRLFHKDADTQTPQNFNEGMNSLESGKLSELRQKELKLRKLEKDLSLREKLLNENSKDRTRLETYTMKLEARNQELEQTVRTLKRKIEILEDQADGVTPPIDSNLIKKANPSQNNNSALENQLQKINDRVATFVLNQIDLQLNKLDGNMNLEENY